MLYSGGGQVEFRLRIPGMSLYPGDERHWHENISPDDMVLIAQRAEELGYDAVHFSEHIVMRKDWVPVMGARWIHCTTAMGFVAGATKKITLAGVVVVPYHDPIELAKTYATIDYLSGGRLLVVALLGYMEWEYELLRRPPFAERGFVMDEYMDAMIELWSSDDPTFDGKYVSFSEIAFEPKPVQQPLPIWLGGYSKPAARRIARIGDGWEPWSLTRPQVAERLRYIREQPAFLERPRPLGLFMPLFEGQTDPDTHEVLEPPTVVMNRDAILEQVGLLAEIGVTITDADPILGGNRFGTKGAEALPRVTSVEQYLERLQWFAEEIFPEGRPIAARQPTL
jgi:probable F420-dependent oxidoreductase